MVGRKTDYTPEIADEICRRLAEGESLKSICRDENLPSDATVRTWAIEDREGFYTPYARARELQAEKWADEIIDIADDSTNDYMERENKDGSMIEVVNAEHIQRSRLRTDTRKWILSKVLPKKFGEKIVNEHTGTDGGPIRMERIERVITDPTNTTTSDSPSVSAAAETGTV